MAAILKPAQPAQPTWPVIHDHWIYQYDTELFVVYDPTTDGGLAYGVTHSLERAKALLESIV